MSASPGVQAVGRAPGSRSSGARRRLGETLAKLARQAPLGAAGRARIGRRHIYILPTGAGLAFGTVVALMLVGSLNYQNNLGLLFTFLLGSIAIVAMHHGWFNLLGTQVWTRAGVPVFAGQDADFSVSLGDDGRRARAAIVVRAGSTVTQPLAIPLGSQTTVSVRVPTTHRGYKSIGQIQLETRYPIGLFRAWCYPQTDPRVVVYPQPARRATDPPVVASYRPNTQGDLGVGADDFVGLRGYRAGDSLRRLDWKALARERGLIVKQFGGDRADEVWLDWDHLPAVETESRISLLCRQVLDAAEQGLSYGLRLPGTVIGIGHGESHKHRCLQALALFEHG
jgi:uncharacterized protein (DUF58 family)